MTENEFRGNPVFRSQLEKCLQNDAFKEAVRIIELKRRANEQAVEARITIDPIASVRMNSQRIGAEGVILDLLSLCEPPTPDQPIEEAAFGKEEELRKLHESDNA